MGRRCGLQVVQVSDPNELVNVDCEFFRVDSTSSAVVSCDEEGDENEEIGEILSMCARA